MKKTLSISLPLLLLLPLCACNLFGGIDKPSSDPQYLEAARACLDSGDFQCALDNYKALSDSYADVRINETALTQLAQARIFSFSDLIGSLGSSLGSNLSFGTLANTLASHGAATTTNQSLIQKIYNDCNSISNVKLKAFSQFIAALSMFNTILGSAVGDDGVLTASDLVQDPGTCATATSMDLLNPSFHACDKPIGSALFDYSEDSGSIDIALATGWEGSPSMEKLIAAASAANSAAAAFIGSSGSSGIFQTLGSLAGISGGDQAIRQSFVSFLGLH